MHALMPKIVERKFHKGQGPSSGQNESFLLVISNSKTKYQHATCSGNDFSWATLFDQLIFNIYKFIHFERFGYFCNEADAHADR